ncbi:TOR1AIP2 [Branchiostoma lanceolatum]|nr:TOR1AIP2 [Branchiostoma lanceolatum]
MPARDISRRIELLTGYSTERLQELVPELEGRRLYMLAHLLIAKANETIDVQGARKIRDSVLVLSVLAILFAVLLRVLWPTKPPESGLGPIQVTIPTPSPPPEKMPPPPPTKIFETRFPHLTKSFSQQKSDVFDPLKTKLAPFVSQEGSALLAITGPSPTVRTFAESLPWVLSKAFVSIDSLQFRSLGTQHRNDVIDDVMKAWSDRPDEVLIVHEPDKLPTDVLEVIVDGCRTAMNNNGVVIATGERPGMDRLSDCGGVTVVDVRRETGLAEPPPVTSGDHEASISTLKKTFPSQSARLWQVSDFVINRHLHDRDPRHPAMLVLAGLPGANRTVNQLAEGLARIYSEEPLVINSRQFSRVDPARGKLHLDRALDSAFRGGRRAAVLTELDTLPPLSAMMLHSYCDHDNAQYKDVAFFMTLQLRESVDPGAKPSQQDKLVRDRLREAWAALGEEKRDPLISRVATMIVLVQHEDSFDMISGF